MGSQTSMFEAFETAIRTKLRFQSPKGEISLEQLYELPLRGDFGLDTGAKTVNKALKNVSEESFVETASNPAQERLELALGIVRHVIDVKLTEETRRSQVAKAKAEETRLLEILAEKQDGKLSELTEKELQDRIRKARAAQEV